jgi:alkylhydroperoxidase family enzyme
LVPQTLEPYACVNHRIWFGGPLGAADLEVARLYNARHVNCVFCRNVRYDIARADGLHESLVAQIDADYEASDLSRRHKLILTLTDRYLNNPHALSQDDKRHLRDEFTAQELAQLCAAIMLFNTFSRCAVALGGMPDELPVMEISVPK